MFLNFFDEDNERHRLPTLIIMLLMIGLSVFIAHDFERIYVGFIGIYTGIRMIIAFQYLLAGNRFSGYRKQTRIYAYVLLTNSAISLIALILPSPWHYYLFYLSVGFDYLLPIVFEFRSRVFKIHSEHLVERTGLFIIIILGESVLSLSNSLHYMKWNIYNLSATITGFILIGGIWWILFDFIYLIAESKRIRKPFIILIPNAILIMGLVIIANIIKHAILNDLEINAFRLLTICGVVIFFIGKQIPYYLLFPRIRKQILLNTLIVFVLSSLSLLFERSEYILISMTVSFIVYIISTFRYLIMEDISKKHVEKLKAGNRYKILKLRHKAF